MGLDFAISEPERRWYLSVDGGDREEVELNRIMTLAEELYYEPHSFEVRYEEEASVPLPDDLPPAPRWAYSGFARFRKRLCEAIGLTYDLMWGFYPGEVKVHELRTGRAYHATDPEVPTGSGPLYDRWKEQQQAWWHEHCVRWEDVDHPLRPLLDHSDCDDDLSTEDCAQIAPALREILATWPEDDHDREIVERLAAWMEACAATGRRLVFC